MIPRPPQCDDDRCDYDETGMWRHHPTCTATAGPELHMFDQTALEDGVYRHATSPQNNIPESPVTFAFVPVGPEPERDGPGPETAECHCEKPDDQYVMEIDCGAVSFVHAACGLPPGAWADEAFFMPKTPVTMTWNSTTDYWSGETDAYGDVFINGLHTPQPAGPQRIVICGSTRYTADMAAIAQRLTWDGIDTFAPILCDLKSSNPLWDDPAERKAGAARLTALHNAKIREAHLILVVGPDAGDSTRSEIAYARQLGKPVRFTDPGLAAEFDSEVWTPETAATA